MVGVIASVIFLFGLFVLGFVIGCLFESLMTQHNLNALCKEIETMETKDKRGKKECKK